MAPADPRFAALFASIAHAGSEVAVFAFLDRAGGVLGLRHCPSESLLSIDVPLRLIAADAIALGASHVVMAHNHPGGEAEPSAADLSATRRLAQALDALGIRLVDHLVLGGGEITSLRARGLL